jgi:hypothetical protein
MSDDPIRELALARLLDFPGLKDLVVTKLLRIHGVEVTQGVQRYRSAEHLTDPNDVGPDNAVRIVAHKPAWIRVYVRSFFSPTTGVTGTVRVFRRQFGFLYFQVAELALQPPGTVTAQPSLAYATERGGIANTLNFVVPADLMCGHLRYDVEVKAGGLSDTRSVHVDATLRQTLRMRIVPVAYDGTDAAGNPLTLPAPTLADAQATAAWSLLVYPVRSTPDITLTAEVELTFPLTGSPANPGGCAQSWLDLNQLVAQAKTADGNLPNTFYYGLVPAAVPIGTNSGCASSGVTSGRVNGQQTMAHEFGHALGYPHSPCGNVGAGDPDFPAYEPYDAANTPGARLGEYGLDISTADVKSPATFRDYMSYCTPRWISLFNYERAVNHPRLNPTTVCHDTPWLAWNELLVDDWWWLKHPAPDPPPWYDEVVQPVDLRQRVISVIGVRDVSGRVDVRSITRAFAVPEVEGARRTGLVAELVDEQGEAIASAPVMRLVSHGGCGCGGGCDGDDERGPYLFQAFLPDVGRGAALRLVEGGEEVWRYGAPSEEPEPPVLEARVSKQGQLALRWRVPKSERPPEIWIRWRAGEDAEPHVLFIASGSGRRQLSAAALPAGNVVLDAVAHDGFSEAVSEPVQIRVPRRPPEVAILHPYDRLTVQAGRPLRLHGAATEPGGEPVDSERCAWRIGRRQVAKGLDAFVAAPPAGDHTVTLTATGAGGRAEARVRLTTVDPEQEAKKRGRERG